jgi:hypothetical protein
MLGLKYNKRPLVENCIIVKASVFVRVCLNEIDFIKSKNFDLRKEEEVKKFVETINNLIFLTATDNNGNVIKDKIQITYIKSNLNKGFIFLFKCNQCLKKTHFLYLPPFASSYLCRECHRLTYKKNNTKESRIIRDILKSSASKLFYLSSNRLNDILYLLEAEKIKAKIEENAVEKVDKSIKIVNNLIRPQK